TWPFMDAICSAWLIVLLPRARAAPSGGKDHAGAMSEGCGLVTALPRPGSVELRPDLRVAFEDLARKVCLERFHLRADLRVARGQDSHGEETGVARAT